MEDRIVDCYIDFWIVAMLFKTADIINNKIS